MYAFFKFIQAFHCLYHIKKIAFPVPAHIRVFMLYILIKSQRNKFYPTGQINCPRSEFFIFMTNRQHIQIIRNQPVLSINVSPNHRSKEICQYIISTRQNSPDLFFAISPKIRISTPLAIVIHVIIIQSQYIQMISIHFTTYMSIAVL